MPEKAIDDGSPLAWDYFSSLVFLIYKSRDKILISMTRLFKYLAPLPIHCLVTSRCMQFIFGDKGEATCLIRECPTCDWKREEGRGEYEHRPLDEIWTCKAYFVLPIYDLCVHISSEGRCSYSPFPSLSDQPGSFSLSPKMNCMHCYVTRQCIGRGAKYLKSRVILLTFKPKLVCSFKFIQS